MQVVLSRCYLLCALIGVLMLVAFPKSTYAEDSSLPGETIKLSVRAIQATIPHETGTDSSSSTSAARSIHVDEDLNDLQAKLLRLPFNSFRLLSRKEETLALKTRDSLQLPNGQSLMFRPIYMDERKVGLWLNWKDRDGSEILNTRVHFNSHDTVLTGTDCSQNEGMILAIRAVELPQ